ncbi:MAG: oxidoreductase, partial [Verrucomicrobiota bacterium]
EAAGYVANETGLLPKDVKTEVQARMSDYAGIICHHSEVKAALAAAQKLRHAVEVTGLKANSPSVVGQAFRWKHMVLVSEAVLTALDYYIEHGGGSRGARAICDQGGSQCPEASHEDLSRFRFIEEQAKDKEEKLIIRFSNGRFEISTQAVDRSAEVQREFFEKGWSPYLIKEG